MELNETYWDNRYKSNDIGWDMGKVSPPLKSYFDQLNDKSCRILIPGGGNSYEAEYLFVNGFKNVHVVDISITALNNIKKRVPDFPKNQLIHKDFFDIEMAFDLIIEQTFFCALNPNLRPYYVTKMHQLLVKNGKLVGLLFDQPLNDAFPPFGGNKKEYIELFSSHFEIKILEKCYNSVSPRDGKELFFKFNKKII